MGSALWAGISGLNASSKELDVIANNLANVNTVGFKAGTTYFADVLSQSISGGAGGSMQVGRGVSVTEVQTQFGSGSFESTGNATDVAIDGDGFFMVNDEEGATYYTRAGAFHLNSSNMLVDVNNYKVQGKVIVNGVAGALGDIDLQGAQSEPSATTTVSMGANLNAATTKGGQYNTTQTVYDSLGASHTLNTIFTKTENAGTGVGGYWGIEAKLDDTFAVLDVNGLYFDENGTLAGTYIGALNAAGVTSTNANPPAATATTTGTGPGVGLNANDAVTLTRTAAGGWTITQVPAGTYASMAVTSANGADPVTIASNGTNNDISLDLSGTWNTGDTAAFNITGATVTPSVTGGGTVSAAALTARANLVTAASNMVLTYTAGTTTWSVTNDGGHAGAHVTSAPNTYPITVSFDATASTDMTVSSAAAGWADANTITLALTPPSVGGVTAAVAPANVPTATAVLDRKGMAYKDGTITMTRGAAASTWTFTGDYANVAVVSTDATTVKLSLDGSGGTDLTLTLAGSWGAGDTATFTLDHTATAGLRDINVNLSAIPLAGGANIGAGGIVTWDVLGDEALDVTQYASASVIRAVTADGYASGQLKTLSIGQDGIISAFFTNGQTSELAQLVLSKFTNPWGLNKLGSNLFGETVTSGSPIQNTPGTSGMGALTPNTLEMSNTDIATEFIKMITSQKAYQASARVVTTQDTIMQELMNLKR
jgi:flagellar hook protein FlgE